MGEGTKDRAEGKVDEAKGKVKETVGEVVDDRSLEDEGRVDQAKGKLKEAKATLRMRRSTSKTQPRRRSTARRTRLNEARRPAEVRMSRVVLSMRDRRMNRGAA